MSCSPREIVTERPENCLELVGGAIFEKIESYCDHRDKRCGKPHPGCEFTVCLDSVNTVKVIKLGQWKRRVMHACAKKSL